MFAWNVSNIIFNEGEFKIRSKDFTSSAQFKKLVSYRLIGSIVTATLFFSAQSQISLNPSFKYFIYLLSLFFLMADFFPLAKPIITCDSNNLAKTICFLIRLMALCRISLL